MSTVTQQQATVCSSCHTNSYTDMNTHGTGETAQAVKHRPPYACMRACMRVHSIYVHPCANTVVCLSGIQEIYRAHQPDKSHCEQEECGCCVEDGKLLVLTLLEARPGVVPTGSCGVRDFIE